MQKVIFQELGLMDYQQAWDYQESLLQENVRIKTEAKRRAEGLVAADGGAGDDAAAGSAGGVEAESVEIADDMPATTHYLLFVAHPPVYTLGKSGHMENVLLGEDELRERGIQFFKANRGGDITYHGPGQLVGYPILDLERFYTDIGKYLRNLEEMIIAALASFGIKGDRSPGETGVWIEPGVRGLERKICAMGVRCSRWVTMHGFALNVNTDLSFFENIIPCGIQDKQVTSMERELGYPVPEEAVREAVKKAFESVFGVRLVGLGGL